MKWTICKGLPRLLRRQTPSRQNEREAADRLESSAEEYDRCVMCGALTGVRSSVPVDWRENYEIGMGQLCGACAKKYSRTDL